MEFYGLCMVADGLADARNGRVMDGGVALLLTSMCGIWIAGHTGLD